VPESETGRGNFPATGGFHRPLVDALNIVNNVLQLAAPLKLGVLCIKGGPHELAEALQ